MNGNDIGGVCVGNGLLGAGLGGSLGLCGGGLGGSLGLWDAGLGGSLGLWDGGGLGGSLGLWDAGLSRPLGVAAMQQFKAELQRSRQLRTAPPFEKGIYRTHSHATNRGGEPKKTRSLFLIATHAR